MSDPINTSCTHPRPSAAARADLGRDGARHPHTGLNHHVMGRTLLAASLVLLGTSLFAQTPEAERLSARLLAEADAAPADVPPDAHVLRVGSDGACDFGSVQEALDAARAPPAHTHVRIARNGAYIEQALQIIDKHVTLEGGYAHCAADAPDAATTALDGHGNGRRPVIRIRNGEDFLMQVALHRLALQGGRTTRNYFICSESRRNGAGLNIRGRVAVTLTRTVVRDNEASSASYSGALCGTPSSNSGGGIYFDGEDFGDSRLTLGPGSSVVRNAALGKGRFEHMHGQGGGIYCKSGRLHLARNAAVAGNRTGGERPGDGGGLYLDRGCNLRSSAGGILGGILMNESAQHGGGIAARTGRIRFDRDGAALPAVAGNVAAGHGGGIYVPRDEEVGFIVRLGSVRLASNRSGGHGGGLYFVNNRSRVELVDALITGNHAEGVGGGIRFGGARSHLELVDSALVQNSANGRGGALYFGASELIVRRAGDACDSAQIARCSRMENNHTQADGGALALAFGSAHISQSVIAGNSADGAGSVAWVSGSNSELHLEGVAIHGNHGAPQLFQLQDRSLTSVDWSTIAGNREGNAPLAVFRLENDERHSVNTRLRVRGSIVWEPGAELASRSGPTFTPSNCTIGHRSLANSGLSVGSRFYSLNNPALRDPAAGDLRLRPNSPAIDYCSTQQAGVQPRFTDLFDNARGVPFDGPTVTPINPGSGDFDLGVHELTP
ncbi:hypothetical protein HUS23_10175 [Ectothiorhodospiraceae bacterium 2226]|nr:hypothetical protein HUS23_10175 [Ectothiorhodospiraceae bacterium 2226]